MRRRDIRGSGAPRRLAGGDGRESILSAAGHAAVIALAVWALPWMKAGPERPGQVVSASLVTPAELAALSQAARRPAAAPPREP